MTDQYTTRLINYSDPAGQSLLTKLREELRPHHSGDPNPVPSAKEISIFILIEHDGKAIACGGLRELVTKEDETFAAAEIKRMYVEPEFRGSKGVSAKLMAELEKQAREHGWKTVYLETGLKMDKSRRFYERMGYHLVPAFAEHVLLDKSVCYAKNLEST